MTLDMRKDHKTQQNFLFSGCSATITFGK